MLARLVEPILIGRLRTQQSQDAQKVAVISVYYFS